MEPSKETWLNSHTCVAGWSEDDDNAQIGEWIECINKYSDYITKEQCYQIKAVDRRGETHIEGDSDPRPSVDFNFYNSGELI